MPRLKFFLLVFALAVPFWLLGELVKAPDVLPIKLPLTAFQLICPLVAAAVLVYRENGLDGIRSLLTRVFTYRGITPGWTMPIVFMMPTIYLLADGIQRLLGRPLPELQTPLPTIVILFAVFFLAAVAEEAGWMGYAFDPMQAQWGALLAAIVLGVVWALFHLVADLQGGHGLGWILWQRSGGVALRILIAWAYNNTGRSVLAAVLVHTTDNVSWQLTETNGAHYDPAVTAPLAAGVAAVVTFLWGPQTLARYRYTSR